MMRGKAERYADAIKIMECTHRSLTLGQSTRTKFGRRASPAREQAEGCWAPHGTLIYITSYGDLAAQDKINAVELRENKVRMGGRTCMMFRENIGAVASYSQIALGNPPLLLLP